MTGERGTERKDIGEITCFRIKLPMCVTAPRTARPALIKELPGCSRQRTREILRAVHPVDCVFDRGRFYCEAFSGLIPRTNDVFDVERQSDVLASRLRS